MGFVGRVTDWYRDASPMERLGFRQGGRPRVTGLIYGDVSRLEDEDAITELEQLPRQGARWKRTEDGWRRWSFLDEAWIADPTLEPNDLPADVADGTVLTQGADGTWEQVTDDPAPVDEPGGMAWPE